MDEMMQRDLEAAAFRRLGAHLLGAAQLHDGDADEQLDDGPDRGVPG